MASPNRVILHSKTQRDYAKRIIDEVPDKCVMTIAQPTRTVIQNAKVWAMLTDISQQEPQGRKHIPEVWKCIIMAALKLECQFAMGLNNEPVIIGYRSSQLTIPQCADMIEFMYGYGAEHNIQWSDYEVRKEAA